MQKSEVNKMLLCEQFHQHRINPDDSFVQHVEILAKQVREAGATVSDAAVLIKILSTLPQKRPNKTNKRKFSSTSSEKRNRSCLNCNDSG